MSDLFFLNEYWPFILRGLRVPAILIAAYVLGRVVGVVMVKLRAEIVQRMKSRHAGPLVELEKRARTIGDILYKAAVTVIWIVAIMMALKEFGFDIGPILAGAGIMGLAVGFGAQNLVRDVITGLFLILENQIRVNDVAIVNGTGGLVEEVNLRTTVLRGQDGTVHVFPNGAITTLSNMTREYSYYVFDLGVAYKEDTDRVVDVIREVAADLMREPGFAPLILEPLEVLGVDAFGDSAVIIKARIKTQPIQQWTVGRELNRRFKKKFDELGIEIPFPHQTLYFGEGSKPFRLELQGIDRHLLKSLIKEVLSERDGTPGPPL